MALVLLPGLTNLIDDISDEKKLAPQVVEAALREALLKGYERYRRTLYIGISEDPFDEDYFSNFDVGLDLEEEGYRVLASKIIVDEVESEDHQIALAEVMQVAEDAQAGDTVVLDVTPEKEDFGRMAAATTKQVLAQKLRDQQRRMIQEEFADLEDPVLTARVIRFERQSIIMAVSSGLGRPEVEAELPRRDPTSQRQLSRQRHLQGVFERGERSTAARSAALREPLKCWPRCLSIRKRGSRNPRRFRPNRSCCP